MKPDQTPTLTCLTQWLLICLLALVSMTAAAAPNPLLPRPQEVQYGNGELPVHGLSIRFSAPPNSEDRFAAEQLASALSAKSGTKVEIRKSKFSGHVILLHRT